MKWTKHQLYRHMSCLDVDIAIHEIVEISNDGIELIVLYYNRHYKWFYEEFDRVKIKRENYPLWTHLPPVEL